MKINESKWLSIGGRGLLINGNCGFYSVSAEEWRHYKLPFVATPPGVIPPVKPLVALVLRDYHETE